MIVKRPLDGKIVHIDLESDKVSYRPKDTVRIRCHVINNGKRILRHVRLLFNIEDSLGNILHMDEIETTHLGVKECLYEVFEWTSLECLMRGFVARVRVYEGEHYLTSSTLVFDVVRNSSLTPRYGFFATFATNEDVEFRVNRLARYHINHVQFYDWFKYHGNYTSELSDYTILGKPIHLDTVRKKIKLSKEKGIKCMAYIPIYAVDERVYLKHPEWALRDSDGKPLRFENWLYLVNPSRECGFHNFLLKELKRSVKIFKWDGIHLDQYGEKWTTNAYWNNREVNITREFIEFINDAKKELKLDIVFNLVDAWPLEQVSKEADVSFIYIELWNYETYADIQRLLVKARRLSSKPIVVAAYTEVHEPTVLLLDAEIFANQGFRIEIGEGNRYLVDAYFPKCEEIPKPLEEKLQNYYDVITRYEEYIYNPDVRRAHDISVKIVGMKSSYYPEPNGVQVIPYLKGAQTMVIHLVNFIGISEMNWKKLQPEPIEQRDITLRIPKDSIEMDEIDIYLVQADKTHEPLKLSYGVNEGYLEIRVPTLKYWDIIIVKNAKTPS